MKRLAFLFLSLALCCLTALSQTGARIDKVWFENDVNLDGNKGVIIHADITANGVKGQDVFCIAYFYDESKNKLMTRGFYMTEKPYHQFALKREKAPYKDTHWSDFPVPCYYYDLPQGTNKLYCKVVVTSDKYILAESNLYPFYATGIKERYTRNTDGSYTIATPQANGTIFSVNYRKCSRCRGTGTCTICRGAGGRQGPGRNSYLWYPCSSCGGSLKCRFCGGNGETSLVSTYYPSSGTMVSTDPLSGKVFISGVNGGLDIDDDSNSTTRSNSSSTTRSSNETDCSNCAVKGNGKCSYCGGKGYKLYDDGTKYTCPMCHQSGACQICHGSGKIRY